MRNERAIEASRRHYAQRHLRLVDFRPLPLPDERRPVSDFIMGAAIGLTVGLLIAVALW